jgi:hypothetical protein
METVITKLLKLKNSDLLNIVIHDPSEIEREAAKAILNYRRTRAIVVNNWIISILTCVLAIAAVLQYLGV